VNTVEIRLGGRALGAQVRVADICFSIPRYSRIPNRVSELVSPGPTLPVAGWLTA